MAHILVKRESNFLPPFQVEYDGKYISLKGRDKNFPLTNYGLHANKDDYILSYDEKILIPIVLEMQTHMF